MVKDNILEAAKALINIITKAGYEAYIIGGKPRTMFHNQFHKDRIKAKDIDIVTNAEIDSLKTLFPRSNDVGKAFNVLIVPFAGEDFEIATYRSDNYYDENGNKLLDPIISTVKTLNEDRARRDFSINSIALTNKGEFVDYTFIYENEKYSGIEDIQNKIIRAIGNPKERFFEDPLRILRAFRFMSQLGYEIEEKTLEGINECKQYLSVVPGERIGIELRKIIKGKYANDALKLMNQYHIFSAKCLINNEQTPILEMFENIDFDIEKFNKLEDRELEIWSEIIDNEHFNELVKFNVFNKEELNTIKWLINNKDLYNVEKDEDYIKAIANSIGKEEKKRDIHYLKMLIDRNNRKYIIKTGDKTKPEKMYFWLCARPYFVNQLHVTGQEILTSSKNKKDGKWVGELKNELLKKLTFAKNYPRPLEVYKNWLPNTMKELGVEIDEEGFESIIKQKEAEASNIAKPK